MASTLHTILLDRVDPRDMYWVVGHCSEARVDLFLTSKLRTRLSYYWIQLTFGFDPIKVQMDPFDFWVRAHI